MNILIVNPNVWMGGAQKVLVQEALELSRLGHDVRILATRVDLSERPELLDRLKIITVDIPILDVVGGRYVPIRGRAKLLARLLRLRSAIREAVLAEGIDIVNPHHPPLHWASAGLGVPTVWTCHEPISLWPSAKPYFVIGDARLTPARRAQRHRGLGIGGG
jgi:thioredoxin reductase